eukprot:9366225-Ditylum_brightwellii.AAC.1
MLYSLYLWGRDMLLLQKKKKLFDTEPTNNRSTKSLNKSSLRKKWPRDQVVCSPLRITKCRNT